MFEDKIQIIKVFKGGSLTSTKLINHPQFKKCVLKKVSNNLNREYGFVRFCSQIKRHSQLQSSQPELFPEIFEVGIDIKHKYAYCIYQFMEDYISIFDFLNDHLISELKLNEAAFNLINSLERLHKNEFKIPLVKGSLEFYLKEEMIRPLIEYEKYLEIHNKTFEGIEVESCHDVISKIYGLFKKLDKIDDQKYCMIHGNATLENILINPKTLEIKFIDVYDETYCDIALSDYSQVLQCSKYFYGIRMRQQKNNEDESKYKLIDAPKNFKVFNEAIEKRLNFNNNQALLLKLLTASQFIRLLPFRIKSNDIKNANYFFCLASWILNQEN